MSESGNNVQQSTVRWTRSGADPFKKAVVRSYGTSAGVTITFKVKVAATCNGGARCTGSYSGTNSAIFDVTKKLKPKWSN